MEDGPGSQNVAEEHRNQRNATQNMWSSVLLLAPPWPSHSHLLFPKPKQPSSTVSATAQPHRRRFQNDADTDRQIVELGRTFLSTIQSNPQRREREGKGAQISGSDVLWALQRASARKEEEKKKKKRQRRGEEELSSVRSRGQESGVDDANVRSLCIKSEWGDKLDELEKRLRELSEII